MNPLRGSVIALAGLVGIGVLAVPGLASASADGYLKRDDQDVDLVLVNDDDDDDADPTNTRNTANTRNTGVSRATNDDTRSNVTRVSRDRDLSRSDNTRDRTYDGPGGSTRDRTADTTNDRSRNDTRAR